MDNYIKLWHNSFEAIVPKFFNIFVVLFILKLKRLKIRKLFFYQTVCCLTLTHSVVVCVVDAGDPLVTL